MVFLRIIISGVYLLLIIPWIVFVLTGWPIFTILGIGFMIIGIILWPIAKRDWNPS